MDTRKAARAQIAAVIKEMVSDKAASKRLVGLLQTLQMESGGTVWLQPPGWDSQGLTKAGRDPNPWYGLFPTDWRSQGNQPLAVVGNMIREREIAALVRVGKAAIQGCEAIWATATKVWATREKTYGSPDAHGKL